MKKFKVTGMVNGLPLAGDWQVDDQAAEAIRRAADSPCVMCGAPAVGARQLVLRKPQAFCLPFGTAVFVGLCRRCRGSDAGELESRILACRMLTACENLGIDLSDI